MRRKFVAVKAVWLPLLFIAASLGVVSTGYGQEKSSLATTSEHTVSASEFAAQQCGDKVWLSWQATPSSAILGFNVYRAKAGKRVRLNPSLIAGPTLQGFTASSQHGPQGFAWSDNVPKGSSFVYWLQSVGLDGSLTWAGMAMPGDDCGAGTFTRSRLLNELNQGAVEVRAAPTAQTELPRALTSLPTGNLSQQWVLAGAAAVKIGVQQSGWYRVTQPQLIANGLDAAALPRSLRLFAEGKEVPIYVSGQNKTRLATTDYIEFYGIGFDIATTDTHVYWLTAGTGSGLRIPASPTATPAATPTASFTDVIQSKLRSVYFSSLLNGDTENFFGAVISSQGATQMLQVPDPLLTGGATNSTLLETAVQGVTAVAHAITVKLNGVTLGTLTFNGQAHPVTQFKVPANALHVGQNTVTFTPTGGQADVSIVDYLRLTYPRLLHAVNNSLTFTAGGAQTVSVTGFTSTSVRVLDVTNPGAVTEITPQVKTVGSSHSISFKVPGSGLHTLLAFATGQFLQPASITRHTPSSWHTAHSADMVIMTPAAFSASAAPLVAHRQEQGLTSQVVNVEDLYDEFSYGTHTPLAIKSFLQRSHGAWSKAPRFALLLGDASLDPRNYMGKGNFDFVPTKLLDTEFVEAASDDWLADFNNDGLPELAVGRIPVRTAAQASAVIAKIVGYTGVAASGQGALLVSDTERGYDFKAANDRFATLLPSTLTVQKISRDDGDAATVHSKVFAAMNQGPLLVNFVGHGSVDIWTGAKLLTTDDALKLTNANRLSLVLCSNCLNGYFIDPVLESIGEGLINNPNGGAIAVWASSGETFPQDQEDMSQSFLRLMFQTSDADRPHTIGEAVVKAKAATANLDVRRTWILFGDPSTPLPTLPASTGTITASGEADRSKKPSVPSDGPMISSWPWSFWPLLPPSSLAAGGDSSSGLSGSS